MFEVNEGQIVVDHADLFQALMHPRVRLPGDGQHAPVHFRSLAARATKRLAPSRQRERRFGGRDPDVALYARNFVDVRLEEARPPESVDGFGDSPSCSDFSERAQEIELPPKRRPLEGASRALNRFAEIPPL